MTCLQTHWRTAAAAYLYLYGALSVCLFVFYRRPNGETYRAAISSTGVKFHGDEHRLGPVALRPHVGVLRAKVVLHVPVLGHLSILEQTLLNRKCSAPLKMGDRIKVPLLSDIKLVCYGPK
jgi:hypothetical protein